MSASTASGASGVQPSSRESNGSWGWFMLRALPNLGVFAILAGVFYFGHHTGWKLSKLSDLFATSRATAEDWCAEHLVPESVCVECNPDLMPKPREFGFCRVHGVAECVICHPELAQITGLATGDETAPRPKYDTSQALSVMARRENNSRNTLHKGRVQFASAESATKAGVDVDVVQERSMTDAISANGELIFDPTRVAHLSSRVGGTVALVLKAIGDEVQPGDILALVDGAQVGQAKSQLLQSIVQLQLRRGTERRLRDASNAVAGKVLAEAESALQEAEIAFLSARQALVNLGFDVPENLDQREAKKIADQLRFLGLPTECLSALPPETKTANLIPVKSPIHGMIVEADVVAGEVIDTAKVLFTAADPKRLWLSLNVRQEDARYLALGLPVVFETDDRSQEVKGTISWISPAIEERTRTLHARVKVDNPDGRLRDKTYGTARIVLREESHSIVVPREAVQATSDAQFVFVRDINYLKEEAPKVFHVRQVRVGAQDENWVELLAGALPGEVVATKGSAVLLAQILRSNLGAGCGCHEH